MNEVKTIQRLHIPVKFFSTSMKKSTEIQSFQYSNSSNEGCQLCWIKL